MSGLLYGTRRALLGGARSIIYILRDEFTTAQSAPLTSPRAAEPGPGGWLITDTNTRLSVNSSGVLVSASQNDNSLTTGGMAGNQSLARVAGRAIFFTHRNGSVTGGILLGGWSTTQLANDSVADIRVSWNGATSIDTGATGVSGGYGIEADSTTYRYAIVLRGTGAFLFVQGGIYTNWTLLSVEPAGTNTPLYPFVWFYRASGLSADEGIDDCAVTDLSGAFSSDYGIATLHQTSGLTSGTNFAADADGEHHLYFSLPGSPAANDTIELRFNVTDANNYNTIYMVRTAIPDWSFKMNTVLGGTPTNRISVTGIATLPDCIRVIGSGSLRDCYTLSGTTWTKRGAQVNVSNQDTSTLTNTTFTGAQFTPTALDSFPRTSSLYNVLSSI